MKRSCALVTALCLVHATSACKKDPEPTPETKTEAKATPPSPTDPSKPTTPDAKPPAAAPTTGTPLPIAPPELEPSYTAQLDPLLDLVPSASEQFFVVRDLDEVLDEIRRVIEIQRPSLLRAMEMNGAADPEAVRAVKEWGSIRASFASSGIELGKGVGIFGNGDASDVLVFAAADPEALNKLATSIGGKPSTLKCRALAEFAGFVACAEKDDGSLDKYVPAKAAAALRAELGKTLPGVDLEEANMLGRWRGDDGPDALAISTAPGLVELHLAAKLDPDFEQAMSPGPAPVMAIAPVGSSFVWAHLDPAFLAAASKDAPGLVTNVVKTLTGEMFFGSTAAPTGLVAMFGVTDPVPASGLVPMFSLIQDQVPKTLPDGTTLTVAVEPVETGTATVQTVHAKAAGTRAEAFAKLGLAPDVYGFVAGRYGSLVAGAGADVVKQLAMFDGTAAPAIASVLPSELATTLQGGKASLAVHIEMDALQNPAVREMLLTTAAAMPVSGSGPSPKDMIDIGVGLAAPWSSASVWVTDDGSVSVIHAAMRGFGDETSEEGKAAHAAAVLVGSGTSDAKTVYGELAGRHAASPRAFGYRARFDATPATLAPAVSGLGIFGMVFAAVLSGRAKQVEAPAPAPVEPPAAPPK
ncbi:MAG: hypothetical protein IAG13_13045 [Deltaproteobacteria bacterium]|nr:hypothetical protein [Nannocystaceae bacterium]